MFRLICALTCLLLVGCGSSTDGSGKSKPLFSIWTESTTGGELDISAQSFDQGFYMQTTTPQGTHCTARYFVSGTDSSGTVTADQITAISGVTQQTNNCHTQISGGYSFTNYSGTLTLCRNSSNSCSIFN